MNTGIEWTDHTWNPVTGCTKVSPGCAHCYAETMAKRTFGTLYPPVKHTDAAGDVDERPRAFTDVRWHDDRLTAPLRWLKPCRVFVNSMSDLFHEDVPDAFIDRVFAVMALAPRHTFQILTKRPARMLSYLVNIRRSSVLDHALRIAGEVDGRPEGGLLQWGFLLDEMWARNERWPLPNVHLGVSVENQHFADERIPLLLQTPAAVRFISAEPLLGPIDFTSLSFSSLVPPGHSMVGADGLWFNALKGVVGKAPPLDWVIVGGESGPKARPCDVAWIRSIVQQCKDADVPVFVKQLGARPRQYVVTEVCQDAYGNVDDDGGWQTLKLSDRKGGDPAEWPEDLRVREFAERSPDMATKADPNPAD